MGYIEFGRLEDNYYQAMAEKAYRGVYGAPEDESEIRAWAIDWESETEACEDRTRVLAKSADEAVDIFRLEILGIEIPDDAVITAIDWIA